MMLTACWIAMIAHILAPLGSALHHAFVAHHFCSEHGIDEHDIALASNPTVTESHLLAARDVVGAEAQASNVEETPAHPAPPLDGDSHERCEEPITPYAAEDAEPEPEVADLGCVPTHLASAIECDFLVAVPLLRLAPKTPPPTAI